MTMTDLACAYGEDGDNRKRCAMLERALEIGEREFAGLAIVRMSNSLPHTSSFGPFSAVSTPIFASKYAFYSIFKFYKTFQYYS